MLVITILKLSWGPNDFYAFLRYFFDSVIQWRNVISGGPRFKIFEGPLVEVLKARVEHRICTSFLGVQRMFIRKFFESTRSLECHFLDFGERFYRILMVRKRHCNISEALANVFALSPKPGGPHLAH
jgi:hypothetical protein